MLCVTPFPLKCVPTTQRVGVFRYERCVGHAVMYRHDPVHSSANFWRKVVWREWIIPLKNVKTDNPLLYSTILDFFGRIKISFLYGIYYFFSYLCNSTPLTFYIKKEGFFFIRTLTHTYIHTYTHTYTHSPSLSSLSLFLLHTDVSVFVRISFRFDVFSRLRIRNLCTGKTPVTPSCVMTYRSWSTGLPGHYIGYCWYIT